MNIPAEAQAIIDKQAAQIAVLLERIADLERRLGLDSHTSNKPPSSDGLKRRNAGSLRKVLAGENEPNKKSGGQAGHKGDTLRQTQTPDSIKMHHATTCAHCHAGLTQKMVTGVVKRQVFDIREPKIEIIEHQAYNYLCSACHHPTQATFPEGVTSAVQYGARVRAHAIYLNAFHLIPEDRVAEAMQDMFGLSRLCPASIVAWCAAKAEEMRPFTEHIATLAAHAPVRHLDETGFRIGGKTQWLHTMSTPALTHYRVTEKRGAIPNNLVGGVVVHDHFKPYYTLSGVEHALCNAHHLRELNALIDIEKEPWAKRMFRVLLKASRAVKRAVEQGKTGLAPRTLRRILQLYDGLVGLGLAFHESKPPLVKSAKNRGKPPRRPGHNLLLRLRDFKNDVLRFTTHFAVPFTNNAAEQAIRMMKVKMKISGGFRTLQAAQTFASLRATIATARKQRWNILQTLVKTHQNLLAALVV